MKGLTYKEHLMLFIKEKDFKCTNHAIRCTYTYFRCPFDSSGMCATIHTEYRRNKCIQLYVEKFGAEDIVEVLI